MPQLTVLSPPVLLQRAWIQSSLTEDDTKSYLERAINEVKKDRQQPAS
jgi:hypothetical protein